MRKLFDRTPAEAGVILRTLKAVATAEGLLPFETLHRATLDALCEHVLRAKVDLDELPETLPEELERRVLDPEVRANLLHLAIAIPLLEPEYERDRARVVERIAARFRVHDRDVRNAERAARGHYTMLALDAYRGSLADIGGTSLKRSLVLYLRGLVHRDADPELAERVHAFASHPQGTVGRMLLDYWRDNEFGVPGEPGSMQSQMFFKHDVHHVLTGYDTTPRGEFAVAGFYTGLGGNDYADFTALLLLQLQVAVQVDPTVAAWRDQFDPAAYFAALERAARCTVDLVAPDWDPWSVVDRPLAEVRREYGIADDGAMVRGRGERWCGALGPPAKRVGPDKIKEARM
ncbi:MAG: hypothetical protein AB1689_12175 [Thermodesulfobacteriota bacterium]